MRFFLFLFYRFFILILRALLIRPQVDDPELLESAVELYGNRIFLFPMQLGDLFERKVLDMLHPHHLLILDGELQDKQGSGLCIELAEKGIRAPGARLISLLDERFERGGFLFSVLIDDEVVEHVIEKGLHRLYLAALHEIAPGLRERVLHQVLADDMIAHLEERVQIQGSPVLGESVRKRLSVSFSFGRFFDHVRRDE